MANRNNLASQGTPDEKPWSRLSCYSLDVNFINGFGVTGSTGAFYFSGPTGPTGPQGPTGTVGNLISGLVTNPSLKFQSDQTLGLYLSTENPLTNAIGFASSGTKVGSISSYGWTSTSQPCIIVRSNGTSESFNLNTWKVFSGWDTTEVEQGLTGQLLSNTFLVAKTPGIYLISCNFSFASDATAGTRQIRFIQNSTSEIARSSTIALSSNPTLCNLTLITQLQTGNNVCMEGFQGGPASLNGGGVNDYNSFSMTKLF